MVTYSLYKTFSEIRVISDLYSEMLVRFTRFAQLSLCAPRKIDRRLNILATQLSDTTDTQSITRTPASTVLVSTSIVLAYPSQMTRISRPSNRMKGYPRKFQPLVTKIGIGL